MTELLCTSTLNRVHCGAMDQITSTPMQSTYPGAYQSTPTKAKSNWTAAIVLLIIGLLAGGAAGYFLGDLLVGKPAREAAATEKQQLQSQIATLQGQSSSNNTTTNTTPGTGTTTPGTGTAPTTSGVTADPQTTKWSTYTNTIGHFSFKYPSDYEVREFTKGTAEMSSLQTQVNDNNMVFAAGIFKKGETVPAGLVRLYDTETNQGINHRELKLRFMRQLPSPLQSGGTDTVEKIDESPITVNGSEGIKLNSYEGTGDVAATGGSTYTGYLFENQFDKNILVSYCNSDQGSQRNVVGCLFLTTFQIAR